MIIRLLLTLALLTSTASLWAARAAAAQAPMRVAVLYFDNNTGDKKLDVLQKGFADMLITDLSQERSLIVVERDKLQALLGEMKLQRRRYFDKRTALRLGKGLGAQYVISGAFAAMKPQMRIDIRMIEIASSRVSLASTVTGHERQLFALEQQLVAKFLAQLRVAPGLRYRGSSPSRVPDVKTLLDYSKAIDLADQGKLRAAELWMSAVAKRAPRFTLAKKRIRDFKARLLQAAAKRDATINADGKRLLENAERYLKAHRPDEKDEQAARTYLAYRAVSRYVPLRVLRAHTAGRYLRLVKPGQQKHAVRLIKAYAADSAQLLKELDAYVKRHTHRYPGGVSWVNLSLQLPPEDETRAQSAGFSRPTWASPAAVKIGVASFLLLGSCDDGKGITSGGRYTIAPPPAVLDKRYAKLGFAILNQVIADEDKQLKTNPRARTWSVVEAYKTYAEALFLAGQRDAGVAKLQQVLDNYPTAPEYKRVESTIKKHLGLERDPTLGKAKRYQDGLKSCRDMDLRVGIDYPLRQRVRARGIKGLHETIAEVEQACRNNPSARRFFGYLYSHAALQAGGFGHCTLFERWMKRYLAEGGSPRDVDGYRRNYTQCPVP